MGLCVLLMVALVPLLAGDLRRLGELQLVSASLLFGALLLQILVTDVVSGGPHALLVAAHLVSYALVAVFLWRNRAVPGLPLLALGGVSNAVTIAVNGGTLPASAAALRRAGIRETPDQFANSAVLHHPRLAWLGDVFAVPAGWPLANVFSIGDVVIVLAAGQCLWVTCRRRRTADPTTDSRALPALARSPRTGP